MRIYETKDFDTIKEWSSKRKDIQLDPEALPKIGAIIDGLACGFVQFTDNNTFFLEGFVTNPKAEAYRRARAVLIIGNSLAQLAKSKGMTRCLVLTRKKTMARLLGRFGLRFEDMKMGIRYI